MKTNKNIYYLKKQINSLSTVLLCLCLAVSTPISLYAQSSEYTNFDLPNCVSFSLNSHNLDSISPDSVSSNSLSLNSVSLNDVDVNSDYVNSNNENSDYIDSDSTSSNNLPDSILNMSALDLEAENLPSTSDSQIVTWNFDITDPLNASHSLHYFSQSVALSNDPDVDEPFYLFEFLPDRNENFLNPVRYGYQVKKDNNGKVWQDELSAKKTRYSSYILFHGETINKTGDCPIDRDRNFTALLDRDHPYVFHIQYNLDGGQFKNSRTNPVPETFTVESDNLVLKSPYKEGYLFAGWFLDSAFTKPCAFIPHGTYIDSDEQGNVANYQLYAKWTSINTSTPKLKSVKYKGVGKVKITFSKIKKADGYELSYSPSKKFKNKVNTEDITNTTSITLSNLLKKTYYFRIRAYTYDSTGQKIYSSYSKSKSCKVKKGVKEYTAKSNSAKISNVKIIKGPSLYVKATVKTRIKSSDESYYLVKVDPINGKVLKSIAKSAKKTNVTFTLPLDGRNELIEGKYAIAIKKGSKYKCISSSYYIKNPEAAAAYKDAFPVVSSKKGMQGTTDPSLGVKHFFLNMDINQVIQNGTIPYTYNGKTYYFNDAFGSSIRTANLQGLVVTGQIMLTWPGDSKSYLVTKKGRVNGQKYYAFNAQSQKSRNELEAAFNFMAERYGDSYCHLDNWILGNEVNMHESWYYSGNTSQKAFINNYAQVYRMLYYAVRSHYKNARTYICLDHTWSNLDNGDWGSKPFMDSFNKEIKSQQKNIQWNLAFHPYPTLLTKSDTWNDYRATDKVTTDYVTPRNLDVLTKYVKKNFGTQTRIILSEQGFTSNGAAQGFDRNGSEQIQAAALTYTFYKAQFNSMIDACIFRAYQDDPTETDHLLRPLNLGIVNASGSPKASYNVFKYMDSPQYEYYVNPYLQILGKTNWKQITPSFKDATLKSMPAR